MELTEGDKALLKSWGYPESNLPQIEEALSRTVYTLDGKRISRKNAISLLGWRAYLSGIARSAFHRSACRQDASGNEILFDSSALFK